MGQKGSPGKVLIHFLYYIKSTITRSDNNLLMKNDVIWNCKKIIISAIKGSYQHISITDHTNWTNDEIHPIHNPTNRMDVSMVDDKSNPFFFAPRSDLLTLRLSKCKDSPKLFSRIKKSRSNHGCGSNHDGRRKTRDDATSVVLCWIWWIDSYLEYITAVVFSFYSP